MIKIVCGVYGHYIDGRVVAKNSESEPFSLTPRQEAELVAKGVAAFVDEVAEVSHTEASAPVGFDEMPELLEGVTAIPDYSIDSKADELRKIGKLCGLTFKVGMSKAEMVEALDGFFAEHLIDEDDAEDAEDDGMDLPDFDPTEAVE